MQSEFRTRLKNDATISGLCGTRIDWNVRPQGKPLPAITLVTASDVRDQHMGGINSTLGPEVQIDIWADKALTAATLRDAVISLLATPATQGAVRFMTAQNIVARNAVEDTEVGQVHREIIRATVWHTPIP